MEEKIAIIIPIKGKVENINKLINSLFNLDYPNFEIIFVDDGMEKSLKKSLKEKYPQIKVLESKEKGPSYARNLGIKNTDAKFVAFTDSDCFVEKNWLRELKNTFDNFPQIAGCGGIQKLPSDANNFEKSVFLFMQKANFFSDYARGFSKKIFEVKHLPSYNVMYKREILLKEGGFLEGLWPGEDVELDYRLREKSYKLLFNASAIVYHYKPKNLKSFIKMMFRYGKAQGFLVKKYGIFRKIHFLPLMTLLFFSLFIYLFFLSKKIFFISLFLFFIFLVIYWKNLFIFLLFIFAFFAWIIGFLKGFFKCIN